MKTLKTSRTSSSFLKYISLMHSQYADTRHIVFEMNNSNTNIHLFRCYNPSQKRNDEALIYCIKTEKRDQRFESQSSLFSSSSINCLTYRLTIYYYFTFKNHETFRAIFNVKMTARNVVFLYCKRTLFSPLKTF